MAECREQRGLEASDVSRSRGHSHHEELATASITHVSHGRSHHESSTARGHSHPLWAQPPQKDQPLLRVTHILVSGDLWEWPLQLQSWSPSKGKTLDMLH